MLECTALLVETLRQREQLRTLFRRENVGNICQCVDKSAGSRLRELQFGTPEFLERVAVDARLLQRLKEGLPVCLMLFPHRGKVLAAPRTRVCTCWRCSAVASI